MVEAARESGNSRFVGLKVFACFVMLMLALSVLPRTSALTTGSVMYTFGNALDDGDSISEYTLFYTIPAVLQTAVPTNITLYLYITELTGWKYWVNNMYLVVTAQVPGEPSSVFSQKVENNITTYQGYRWGPFNVTVDLSNSQVGLKPGQSTPISFFGDLTANEQWTDPYYYTSVPVEASMQLGANHTLEAPTAASSAPVSHHDATAIAIGAVLVAGLTLAVLATTRKKPKAPAQV